jgi:tetratricopeptide (TPR) repeat protein
LDSNFAECHYLLAEADLWTDEIESALQHYSQTISIEPGHGPGYLALCEAYLSLKLNAEAEQVAREGIRLLERTTANLPTLYRLHVLLGVVAQTRHDYAGMIEALAPAEQFALPAHPEFEFMLGSTYALAGPSHRVEALRLLTGFREHACHGELGIRFDEQCRQSALLIAKLGPVTNSGLGGATQPGASSSQLAFSWLLGRWKGQDATAWTVMWSEPNQLHRPAKWEGDEHTQHFTLELGFAEVQGRLQGALSAVTADARRLDVVKLVISREQDGYTLIWHEANVQYRFALEGSGPSHALAPGDVEAGDAAHRLRFRSKARTSSRTPYPIIIELWLADAKLDLRRVQGPQHGAAVDQVYSFERL